MVRGETLAVSYRLVDGAEPKGFVSKGKLQDEPVEFGVRVA
jgi:hypothetical protein